jgi:hypothetical protein
MKDMLLLGSSQSVLQSDGTTNYSGVESAEANSEMYLLTKAYTPLGPSGDCVFRRVYLSFSHTDGAAFMVTPIVDGRYIYECIRIVNRPPHTSPTERFTAVIPLGERTSAFGNNAAGVRGTSIQLEIKTTAPDHQWHLEGIEISFQSGTRAKRQ